MKKQGNITGTSDNKTKGRRLTACRVGSRPLGSIELKSEGGKSIDDILTWQWYMYILLHGIVVF